MALGMVKLKEYAKYFAFLRKKKLYKKGEKSFLGVSTKFKGPMI